MTTALLVACLVALAGYVFVSGFHDAPNAVAVSVQTRALTPQTALRMSAICNFIGVFLSGVLLASLAPEWIKMPHTDISLAVILTAVIAPIVWGLITWWFRMPSSSTHSLFGGLAGAAWAANSVGMHEIEPFEVPFVSFFLIPLVLVPILIFGVSWLLVLPLRSLVQRAYPRTVNRVSRNILSLSTSVISLLHGIQVGQRVLALLMLVFLAGQVSTDPALVSAGVLGLGLALSLGTMFGGWRIGYTFAHKMVRLDPFRGAVAQGTTATFLSVAQALLNTSVSSSHLAATSVLGAGMNQRFSAVRPGIAAKLMLTWIATVPLSFAISAILFLAASPLLS